MLTAITTAAAADGVNIENMLNKSRGDYAYTMLDVAAANDDAIIAELEAIDGVIRVRIV